MVFLKAPPDMRLLIAEDEPDFRSVLAKSLRAQGYAVDEAGDGIDVLHKAESSDYISGENARRIFFIDAPGGQWLLESEPLPVSQRYEPSVAGTPVSTRFLPPAFTLP